MAVSSAQTLKSLAYSLIFIGTVATIWEIAALADMTLFGQRAQVIMAGTTFLVTTIGFILGGLVVASLARRGSGQATTRSFTSLVLALLPYLLGGLTFWALWAHRSW